MAIYTYDTSQNSSPRSLAMALAIVSAIVLSPLYNLVGRKNETTPMSLYDTKPSSSGFVLPVIIVGLIIAIRTVSSSSSTSLIPSAEPSWALRIGSSSWGLAGVLLMLVFVLSWQHSVKEFLWR